MRDLVIYFAGGTMTGIFGAAVAMAFERNNIYPRIKAIYGASAGVMTGAYFLVRQTELGASIYWENLNTNFISIDGFYIGVWQRFKNKFLKTVASDKMRDALNIDYLMDHIKNKKRLDTYTLLAQDIPLYAKFFDLDNHDLKYIDVRRKDVLDILKMSVNVFPYVHNLEKIDNNRYIDAGVIEIIGIDHLIEKYPDDKILVILNRPIKTGLNYRSKNFLEGKFMEWMFDDPKLYKIHISAEDGLRKDVEKIRENPNVILITLPDNVPIKSRTTSSAILLQAYRAGIEEGNKILANLSL